MPCLAIPDHFGQATAGLGSSGQAGGAEGGTETWVRAKVASVVFPPRLTLRIVHVGLPIVLHFVSSIDSTCARATF